MPKGVYQRRPALDRFLERVNKNGPVPAHRPDLGPCWLWTGGTFGNGYGRLSVAGVPTPAHRFSLALAIGPLEDRILACHHCDTPLCVRSEHLFPGTAADNVADMVAKGRNGHRSASATVCYRGHPLAGKNVYWYRGIRHCMACRRIHALARYHRIRAETVRMQAGA